MKDIFLWVVLPLILAEAVLVGPWIAERLLRWGTRWLPEEYRERYTADWLGELDAVPGSLFKLGFAIRVLLSVPATERALTGRDALWVLITKRLLDLAATGLVMAVMAFTRLGGQLRSNPERAEAFEQRIKQQFTRPPKPSWTTDDPEKALIPVNVELANESEEALPVTVELGNKSDEPGPAWKLLEESGAEYLRLDFGRIG